MRKLFGLLLLLLAVSSCEEDTNMIIHTPQRIHLYPGEQKQIEAESSQKNPVFFVERLLRFSG